MGAGSAFEWLEPRGAAIHTTTFCCKSHLHLLLSPCTLLERYIYISYFLSTQNFISVFLNNNPV